MTTWTERLRDEEQLGPWRARWVKRRIRTSRVSPRNTILHFSCNLSKWEKDISLRDKHRSENPPDGSRQTLSWSTHFDAPRLPDDQDVILWLRYNVITSFVFVATSSASSFHWSAGVDLFPSLCIAPLSTEKQIANVNEQTSWCKFWNKILKSWPAKRRHEIFFYKDTDRQKIRVNKKPLTWSAK